MLIPNNNLGHQTWKIIFLEFFSDNSTLGTEGSDHVNFQAALMFLLYTKKSFLHTYNEKQTNIITLPNVLSLFSTKSETQNK